MFSFLMFTLAVVNSDTHGRILKRVVFEQYHCLTQ